MRAILPVLACLLLAACGLKDDLYLPDRAENEPVQQSSEEDDHAEDA
jgi:predicted small lipoprotein YifL